MATATVARAAEDVGYRSAEELCEVLDRLLGAVDGDERVGPMLRAARVRVRLEFTDLKVALNLASAESEDCCVEWDFAERPPWHSKLTLKMDSVVANRYLQGSENVAIAIARGHIACSGHSRAALVFLPAAKLLVEPYRRLIAAEYPHLEVG